jgi:Xaa-Pro aminopeptidase
VVEAINPSALFKSRKSAGEAANIRETMAEDGAAMCEFYARFESDLGGSRMTEMSVDERLTGERRRRQNFIKPSFPTIAGFNAHGALPHYVATSDTDVAIEGHGLLLIDSGGQFLGGTTDITRMWPIGDVTPAMKRDVTMVLKAHVAMTTLRFPRGTLSTMLDAVARVPMWQEGMDYAHGTGHGVGYCLGVHEGPQTFRQAIPDPAMAMEPGMVMSIEPALYRPGQWGVRIENLVLVAPAQVTEGKTFGEFLEFETLSLCPIDTRSLERGLLQDHEVRWLNRYHDMVRERLSPRLSGAALDWLLARTQAI